jgi:hypothetical protein
MGLIPQPREMPGGDVAWGEEVLTPDDPFRRIGDTLHKPLCWLRASSNGTIRLWESTYVQADKDLNGGCGADERAGTLFD